LSIRALVAKT